VKKMKQGTFIHQDKYTKDLMKTFNMTELKPVSTPMSTAMTLDPDENGDAIDQREYRSMIGSLLYLTAGHSVRQVHVCSLLGFPTLFTSDSSSMNFQVSQTHTKIWDLVFAIPMAWFEGQFVFHLVYFISFYFSVAFPSYSPNLPIASPVILACIWLIILIIMLG
jgi:hypothetical protein